MKKSIFLLLAAACFSNAVEIKSINFKGLLHLSPEVAKDIMGLKVGDELTGESSDRAIANLFKQNYFDDIYIEEKDGDILVVVKEKPSIARLDIKGVVTNDKTTIDGLIGIKQGNMYCPNLSSKSKPALLSVSKHPRPEQPDEVFLPSSFHEIVTWKLGGKLQPEV